MQTKITKNQLFNEKSKLTIFTFPEFFPLKPWSEKVPGSKLKRGERTAENDRDMTERNRYRAERDRYTLRAEKEELNQSEAIRHALMSSKTSLDWTEKPACGLYQDPKNPSRPKSWIKCYENSKSFRKFLDRSSSEKKDNLNIFVPDITMHVPLKIEPYNTTNLPAYVHKKFGSAAVPDCSTVVSLNKDRKVSVIMCPVKLNI